MAEASLRGLRVLVAEDEYLVADALSQLLAGIGAHVLGPAPTVERAIELIETEPAIDGAVLDINLGGDTSYAVADLLTGRGVPFLFTTGYGRSDLPQRYADAIHCQKPIDFEELKRALGRTLGHS